MWESCDPHTCGLYIYISLSKPLRTHFTILPYGCISDVLPGSFAVLSEGLTLLPRYFAYFEKDLRTEHVCIIFVVYNGSLI